MTHSTEQRALLLYDVLKRMECTAELVMGMTLLDRLLAASIAGVADANDTDWTTVLRLFRAVEDSP